MIEVILTVDKWPCHCCFLLFSFCYPLCMLGKYGGCGFLCRECFCWLVCDRKEQRRTVSFFRKIKMRGLKVLGPSLTF